MIPRSWEIDGPGVSARDGTAITDPDQPGHVVAFVCRHGWSEPDRRGGRRHVPTEGDRRTVRLIAAAPRALRACLLLARAYRAGEDRGGSVHWEDVDAAREAAEVALAQAGVPLPEPAAEDEDGGA